MHLNAEHLRMLSNAAHTERVKFAFSLHGLAYDLTHVLQLQQYNSQRGLRLAHAMRLATWCGWYEKPREAVGHKHTSVILNCAANLGNFPLLRFDGVALARYLHPLTYDQRDRLCNLLMPACFYFRNVISRREFLEILMKEHDYSAVPKDVYDRLDASLSALEGALLKRDPQMKDHLRESHSLLVSYPETVNLLRESEVHTLIAAAEQHVQTEIVKQAAAGKTGGAGNRKQISLNDI